MIILKPWCFRLLKELAPLSFYNTSAHVQMSAWPCSTQLLISIFYYLFFSPLPRSYCWEGICTYKIVERVYVHMQPDNSNLMFVFPFHRSGNRKQKDDLFFFSTVFNWCEKCAVFISQATKYSFNKGVLLLFLK